MEIVKEFEMSTLIFLRESFPLVSYLSDVEKIEKDQLKQIT